MQLKIFSTNVFFFLQVYHATHCFFFLHQNIIPVHLGLDQWAQ